MDMNTPPAVVPTSPPAGWPATAQFPSLYKKDVRLIHYEADSKLSLVQRKLMTVLLANSFHTDSQNLHTYHFIKVKSICDLVGWEHSRDRKSLIDSLKKLAKVQFLFERFDLVSNDLTLRKDSGNSGKAVGISQFMADAWVYQEDGHSMLRYMLGPSVRAYAHGSRDWSEVNLETIKRMTTELALALYEILSYFRSVGETGWISLETLQALLGTKHNLHYQDTRRLTQKVLQPAMQIVSKESDIEIGYEAKRENRKIVAFKFKVLLKTGLAAARQASIEGMNSTCFDANVLKLLLSHGVQQKMAEQIAIDHCEAVIMDAIEYSLRARDTVGRRGEGKRFNLGGYIVSTLQNGWGRKTDDEITREAERQKKVDAKKQLLAEERQRVERAVKVAEASAEVVGAQYIEQLEPCELSLLKSSFLADPTMRVLYRKEVEDRPQDWHEVESKGLRQSFLRFAAMAKLASSEEMAA